MEDIIYIIVTSSASAISGILVFMLKRIITKMKKKEIINEEEKVKETKKEIPDVKFDVATLSREKLSQEYVAGLMERIANLEDSGENVDREELLMLNAELDAILEILRQ